jgi:fluoroquinolone resistance protein
LFNGPGWYIFYGVTEVFFVTGILDVDKQAGEQEQFTNFFTMLHEPFYDNRIFQCLDYSDKKPETGEFTDCTFIDCNFTSGDFSTINFIECTFERCNVSLVKLAGTGLKNVHFVGCKIVGVDFGVCNDLLLSLEFEKCNLEYSYFQKKKLKKTEFKECTIKEANFSETDLTGSAFLRCDLLNTVFDRTILDGVDFRTAFNYCIDPVINRMKKAKFSYQGVKGLLYKYDIEIE